MSEIQLFQFGTHPIRVVGTDEYGYPIFIARDVCDALKIRDAKSSLRALDNDEKGVHTMHTPGGPQVMTTVNEPGLYVLVLKSRKEEAKLFKKWVTHEVLPSIRKTGQYTKRATVPANLNIETLMEQTAIQAQLMQAWSQQIQTTKETAEKAQEVALAVSAETRRLALRVEATDRRQQELFDRQKAAEESIQFFEEPKVEPPEVNLRKRISLVVRSAGVRTGKSIAKLWRAAYTKLKYTEGFDALARAKNAKARGDKIRDAETGKKRDYVGLDFVEKANLLDKLYAIALSLYGKPSPFDAPPSKNPDPIDDIDDLDAVIPNE